MARFYCLNWSVELVMKKYRLPLEEVTEYLTRPEISEFIKSQADKQNQIAQFTPHAAGMNYVMKRLVEGGSASEMQQVIGMFNRIMDSRPAPSNTKFLVALAEQMKPVMTKVQELEEQLEMTNAN